MKISQRGPVETRCGQIDVIVTRYVQAIFRRLPMLTGFCLGPDFELAELSVSAWSGYTESQDLREAVIHMLVELGEMHPEAVTFMRGRTFARCLH
jgi:hypothetical protein